MCLIILNADEEGAVEISRTTPLDFCLRLLDEERSLQKKGAYTRRIACLHFGCCCLHKETQKYTQRNNMRSSHGGTKCIVVEGGILESLL